MSRQCKNCEWWQVDFFRREVECDQEDSVKFRWKDSVKWYYKYEYVPLTTGECRKCRPLLVGTQKDVSGDYQKYAVVVSGKSKTEWPQTAEKEWCGEFKTKA